MKPYWALWVLIAIVVAMVRVLLVGPTAPPSSRRDPGGRQIGEIEKRLSCCALAANRGTKGDLDICNSM